MKLPDVNVLVYSVNRSAQYHAAARRWLDDAWDAPGPVVFCWTTLKGFVRLATHPRVMSQPLPISETAQIVRDWLAHPNAQLLEPGPRHAEIFLGLIEKVGAAGNLTTDAHLAALALEHKLTVFTFDHDFGRFPGLRWTNLAHFAP